MKFKLVVFSFCFFVLIFCSCGGKVSGLSSAYQNASLSKQSESGVYSSRFAGDRDAILQSIEELADLERAGSWFQGMALTESGLRENAGDFCGAVAAVYKELAFAYGFGLIEKEYIETCLSNILDARSEENVTAAVNAIFAFTKEQWLQASDILSNLFNLSDEPDGFVNWMILVCTLEKDGEDRRAVSAYKAIRSRYVQFPEYWYRGARNFSGAVSAEYAENCINLSPEGPFASECRAIIAVCAGLQNEDGLSILTKKEIEAAITQSINAGDPELLALLFPLIGLPDNPYTVYATGALRALTSISDFREYFSRQASASRGRLAERLLYISRG